MMSLGASRAMALRFTTARRPMIGRTLGFELTEPAGLLRAGLGLTAWRLLDG
jgi:hypothetical protein